MVRDLLGETKSKTVRIYAKVDDIMPLWRYLEVRCLQLNENVKTKILKMTKIEEKNC